MTVMYYYCTCDAYSYGDYFYNCQVEGRINDLNAQIMMIYGELMSVWLKPLPGGAPVLT